MTYWVCNQVLISEGSPAIFTATRSPFIAESRLYRSRAVALAAVALCALADSALAQSDRTFLLPLLRLTSSASPIQASGYATVESGLTGDLVIYQDGSLDSRSGDDETFFFQRMQNVPAADLKELNATLGADHIGQMARACRFDAPFFFQPFGVAATPTSDASLYWYGKNGRTTTITFTRRDSATICPDSTVSLLRQVLGYAQEVGQESPTRVIQSSFQRSPAGAALSGTVLCSGGQPAQGTATLYAGPHLSCNATGCQPTGAGTVLGAMSLDSGGSFQIIAAATLNANSLVMYLDITADSGSCGGAVSQPYTEFAVNPGPPWSRNFQVQLSDQFTPPID
jgi:hypothetical protein